MSEVPSGAGILPIDNDIEPEDSISQLSAARSRSDRHSNASSKSRSRVSKSSSSSHVSSIKSARVKESLKKVTLMAEARNLVERQSLLRKEFELSMEKQSLDLSTNLAIATAKEEILLNAELDNDNMTGSCVSEVRSKPVGTGPSVCSSVKPEGLLTDDPSVHLSTKGDKSYWCCWYEYCDWSAQQHQCVCLASPSFRLRQCRSTCLSYGWNWHYQFSCAYVVERHFRHGAFSFA